MLNAGTLDVLINFPLAGASKICYEVSAEWGQILHFNIPTLVINKKQIFKGSLNGSLSSDCLMWIDAS